MENLIDTYVMQLFKKLVFEDNSYYDGAEDYGGARFIVNGTKIVLKWFANSNKDTPETYANKPIDITHFKGSFFPSHWEVCTPNNTGYHFVLEIDKLRQLNVPKLDRVREAEVLTRLELLANIHEESVLKNLLSLNK